MPVDYWLAVLLILGGIAACVLAERHERERRAERLVRARLDEIAHADEVWDCSGLAHWLCRQAEVPFFFTIDTDEIWKEG